MPAHQQDPLPSAQDSEVIAIDILIVSGLILIGWIAFKAGSKFGKHRKNKE